jgi:hypothetical protein
MNKFKIVGLAVLFVMLGSGVAQSEPGRNDSYVIQFTGEDGAKVHGSIMWTDANNPQKPTQLVTVDGVSSASSVLSLPTGSIVSASGSSNAFKSVNVKIYLNRNECDDNPSGNKTVSGSKTCTP